MGSMFLNPQTAKEWEHAALNLGALGRDITLRYPGQKKKNRGINGEVSHAERRTGSQTDAG